MRKRKVALYLDEVVAKFSAMDVLIATKDWHRRMADDARYAAKCRRAGREVPAKRLRIEFIAASPEELDRLAVWFDKYAEAIEPAIDEIAQIKY